MYMGFNFKQFADHVAYLHDKCSTHAELAHDSHDKSKYNKHKHVHKTGQLNIGPNLKLKVLKYKNIKLNKNNSPKYDNILIQI